MRVGVRVSDATSSMSLRATGEMAGAMIAVMCFSTAWMYAS